MAKKIEKPAENPLQQLQPADLTPQQGEPADVSPSGAPIGDALPDILKTPAVAAGILSGTIATDGLPTVDGPNQKIVTPLTGEIVACEACDNELDSAFMLIGEDSVLCPPCAYAHLLDQIPALEADPDLLDDPAVLPSGAFAFWLPMESAPDDGTPIFLRDDEYAGPQWVYIGTFAVSYTDDEEGFWAMQGAVNVSEKLVSQGFTVHGRSGLEPTGWAPVPGGEVAIDDK